MKSNQIHAIILSKIRYGDDNLIIKTLTEAEGQLSFIYRYALRQSSKKFPAVDLFREVDISYRENKDAELQPITSADLISSHDGIARDAAAFREASWLCRFLIQNTVPHQSYTLLYRAVLFYFKALDTKRKESPRSLLFAVLLTFLEESGQLPDLSNDQRKQASMLNILQFARNGKLEADYSDTEWRDLYNWIIRFMADLDISLPNQKVN